MEDPNGDGFVFATGDAFVCGLTASGNVVCAQAATPRNVLAIFLSFGRFIHACPARSNSTSVGAIYVERFVGLNATGNNFVAFAMDVNANNMCGNC